VVVHQFKGLEFANIICETGDKKWLFSAKLGSARRAETWAPSSTRSRPPALTRSFREKISGARADRPQRAELMQVLKAGDLVVVTKLDRFGRSTRELLNLIDQVGRAGASFRSLGDPLWDTSSAQGRLLATLLAGIAEFERELIRERTGEGRKRAMAAGVKFGRKRKLSEYQRAEAVKRRAVGETLTSIAKSYGVAISMIARL
jgi:DNA invertase Pin-like site-specific DNA recombinase